MTTYSKTPLERARDLREHNPSQDSAVHIARGCVNMAWRDADEGIEGAQQAFEFWCEVERLLTCELYTSPDARK